MESGLEGIELAIKVLARAVHALSGEVRRLSDSVEAERKAAAAHRAVEESRLAALEAASSGGPIAWAHRNPIPAMVLILAFLLSLQGRLDLLAVLIPGFGATHAATGS